MPKAATIQDFIAAETAAKDAARDLPSDWKEGVKQYLARTEEGLSGQLHRAMEQDYDGICRRIGAVRAITKLVTDTKVEGPKATAHLARFTMNDDSAILLSQVLTPPGWEDSIGALLRQAADAAKEAGITASPGEERRLNFAKVQELDACLAWLREVNTRGRIALESQRTTALRAVGR
jgi:hypothetical protein